MRFPKISRTPALVGILGLAMILAFPAAAVLTEMELPDGAGSDHSVRLVQLSHTPSLDCSVSNTASSDVEPSIAVDPSNPNHIAATWWIEQPDKHGAHATEIATSESGGRKWQTSVQPGVDSCTGRPEYSRSAAHDGWATFGPDGRIYVVSQSGKPGVSPVDSPLDEGGLEALWISRSDDHGRNWNDPSGPLMESSATFGITDQARITVDPRHPNIVYIVAQVSNQTRYETTNLIWGSLYFTHSEDYGETWSTATVAYTPPPDPLAAAPYFPRLHVLSDGTLLVIFDEWNGTETFPPYSTFPNRIYAIRSADGGAHWSTPLPILGEVAESRTIHFFPDAESAPGGPTWAMDGGEISSALAPDGQTVYVTWQDNSSVSTHAQSHVHVARSSDGGRNWTETALPTTSSLALQPTIAVARDRTVGVTWYDLRNDGPGDDKFSVNLYFASSRDGGASWREFPVTDAMDLRTALPKSALGYYIGDYFGLEGLPHGFAAAFIAPNPLAKDGGMDTFFAEIQPKANG